MHVCVFVIRTLKIPYNLVAPWSKSYLKPQRVDRNGMLCCISNETVDPILFMGESCSSDRLLNDG